MIIYCSNWRINNGKKRTHGDMGEGGRKVWVFFVCISVCRVVGLSQSFQQWWNTHFKCNCKCKCKFKCKCKIKCNANSDANADGGIHSDWFSWYLTVLYTRCLAWPGWICTTNPTRFILIKSSYTFGTSTYIDLYIDNLHLVPRLI